MEATFPPPILLDDFPETTWEGLRLGLQDLSVSIAGLTSALPSGSAILLSGDWGIGKTSLLKAIEGRLQEVKAPVVWFDAWRYESSGALLPALLRAVWKQSQKPDEIKEAIFLPLWRSALAVGLKFAPEAASLAGFGFLKPLLKILDPAALKGALEAVPTLESLVPPEDETEKVQGRFKELLEKGWPGRNEEQRVIVLIDDLDRCSPTGMVALLEGIRLLLVGSGEAPCSFVVALDKEVLAQAIARHYAGISAFDSHRYLEKLFPVHFAVPAPSSVDVETLVSRYLGSEVDADQRDALATVLREPFFANPRLMKRCVNRFRLVNALEKHGAAAKDPTSSTCSIKALAQWIAATERWAVLRPLLLRRDDAYWQSVGASMRDKIDPPDLEAESLLREPSIRPWLQREMVGRTARLGELRVADDRLRRWGL